MSSFSIRPVDKVDANALIRLENECFQTDQLSARSFQHWIKAKHRVFLVIENSGGLVGYGLVILHKGTRLARLYSIAISPTARGQGLSKLLMAALEEKAVESGKFYMRLEVANKNIAAIRLYESLGYKSFGIYEDYYSDHSSAIRMQKRIGKYPTTHAFKPTPWYQQTTVFSCGPAALMMAMARLDEKTVPDQKLELDLWRESTTIFMTSGHGGCHPVGLGLTALQRGFQTEVFLNQTTPLFLEGVRSQEKKNIMTVVDEQFHEKANASGLKIIYQETNQSHIQEWLNAGKSVLVMISTYRLDGKKAPHWVTITGLDDQCFYVHDPWLDSEKEAPIDCQHLPIAREDFDKMSMYGKGRLRTAIVLSQ